MLTKVDFYWWSKAKVTNPAQTFQSVFENIHLQQMQDLPLCNPALNVEVLGFDDETWPKIGVLLTPWCMNLILLTQNADALPAPGNKVTKTLPSGEFEFIVASESKLGSYLSCSLFSPMFEFEDQAAAILAAQTVLETVKTLDEPKVPESQVQQSDSSGWSRRDFLRGGVGK